MTCINLLPWRAAQREKIKKQFFLHLVIAIFLTLLCLLLLHIILENRAIYLNRKSDEISALKKQISESSSRINTIQNLQLNYAENVHLFDELVKMLPDGIYLTQIKREGKTIFLYGRESSNEHLSELMRRVEKSHWIANPVLEEIKSDPSDARFHNTFVLQFVQKSRGEKK